jgi:hypothetical protein
MKMIALLLAAVLSTSALAAPDVSSLPPIVRSGLTAYKADGAQAAITAWMISSPIALGEQPQHEVRALQHFEGQFGAYQDFHLVRIVTISPTTQMIYIQLDYLKGPAFGKFLVYQAKGMWSVVNFGFSADPEAAWNFSLFSAPETL